MSSARVQALAEAMRPFLPKSPWSDVMVLPASVCEIPGCCRPSLTATDDMIDRALPGFAAAFEHADATRPAAPAPASRGPARER